MPTVSFTSSYPPTARLIISRIRSPFAAKARSNTDFHIQNDEPYRQFAPGDIVKGTVLLTVHKPLRVTHLVICLYGSVKVFKNADAAGEGSSGDRGFLGTGRGRRGAEYFGNGLASIFEDEVVLCGEGRLDIGVYKFRYEIQIPTYRIPSSFHFERGIIAYTLTSTLTRPTTITPTISCDRKICVVESVDIAPVRIPKIQVITLEPILRRSKATLHGKTVSTGSEDGIMTVAEDFQLRDRSVSSELNVHQVNHDPPESPVASEVSSVSAVSSSRASSQAETGAFRSKVAGGLKNAIVPMNKTIKATAELLRGGCLAGDSITVKIFVEHTKVVKSIQGIIVTLYRLGRIDTHPAVPLQSANSKYYPRSRTGLGGLSLSSAGTSHVFRMDLDQNFAPLMIDPQSLTAEIKTSVRVPDDAFPTISCVPGAMISFSYFVEVVMDLRGKLVDQDRFRPRMSMTGASSAYGYVNNFSQTVHGIQGTTTQANGQNFADTTQIRREKSVVACIFEVVVGTKDSQRSKRINDLPGENLSSRRWDSNGVELWLPPREDTLRTADNSHVHDQNDLDGARPPDSVILQGHNPQVEDTSHLDEKTLLRLAEERLLPSAPPVDDDGAPLTMSPNVLPSAPTLDMLQPQHSSHPSCHSAHHQPSERNSTADLPSDPNAVASPLHPVDPSSGSDDGRQPEDDKQEMERQRLLALRSAPDLPDHHEGEGSANHAHEGIIPGVSAPVFDAEGHYRPYPISHGDDMAMGIGISATGGGVLASEDLPQYQR